MATMTDDQLADWRAKRTGKALPQNASSGAGGPDSALASRSPLDGFAMAQEDTDEDTDTFVPVQAPAPAVDPQTQNQLDAALGRLGPLQRQNEELQAALTAQQRATAAMQSQLDELMRGQQASAAKEAAASFNPFEGLSQEAIDMLDPSARDIVEAAARNAFAKAAGNIKDPEALIAQALAKRDEKAKTDYIRSTANSLGLVALSNDNKFSAFLSEDDSANFLLNSFFNSPDVDTARSLEPNLRKMLKRYEKSTTSPRTHDPQDKLSTHLSRDSSKNGLGGNPPGSVAKTPEDARRIRNQATQLMRARKFDEANKLIASLTN